MLKKIGIGILVIIALVVVISFFLPSEVTVERSIVINAPTPVIYNQVNDLHNWDNWSPWAELDPDMKLEFSGAASGKDAKYCWEGDPDKVGTGCLTIVNNVQNESINTLLEFEGMSPAYGSWKFEDSEGGVKVTWTMLSNMDDMPVVGRYFGLAFDGMLGPDFEKGLSNLKSLSESMPAEPEMTEEEEVKEEGELTEEADMPAME